MWVPMVIHKKEKDSPSAVVAYLLIHEVVKWVSPVVSVFKTPSFSLNTGRNICARGRKQDGTMTMQSVSRSLLPAQRPSGHVKLRADPP